MLLNFLFKDRYLFLPGVSMVDLFKELMDLLELSRTDPLAVLEEEPGKVTDTVTNVLGGIMQAEETRGHMLKYKEAKLLGLEEFKERVKKSKFVVVVEDSEPGSGVVIR